MTLSPLDLDNPVFQRACSVQEVADFLGVSRVFVEREARKGKLRSVKLAERVIRILPGDLVQWLESRSRPVKATEPEDVAEEAELVTA